MGKIFLYFKISYGLMRVCHNWPILLLNHFLVRIGLVQDKIRSFKYIKLRSGVRLVAPSGVSAALSDLLVVYEIWYKKVYFFGNDLNIKNGDIVFDIGANKGIFSVFASELGAKVFAFEPMSSNFSIVRENITLNKANVFPEQVAVSDRVDKIQLNISPSDGGHSIVNNISNHNIEVDSISLSKICEKHNIERIDFLKMDCEGAEYQILNSLSKEDFLKIDKISMEYHKIPGHTPEELVEILESNNFKILDFSGEYIKAVR